MNTSLIKPTDFKAAWEASFLVNRRHLLWNSSKRRTAYMAAYIYRTVAECFPGIGIEYEYNDIDAVLYRVGSDDIASSIEVAIEHENDVRTIATEVHNLA
jgi:hypothetical protein